MTQRRIVLRKLTHVLERSSMSMPFRRSPLTSTLPFWMKKNGRSKQLARKHKKHRTRSCQARPFRIFPEWAWLNSMTAKVRCKGRSRTMRKLYIRLQLKPRRTRLTRSQRLGQAFRVPCSNRTSHLWWSSEVSLALSKKIDQARLIRLLTSLLEIQILYRLQTQRQWELIKAVNRLN